MKKTWVLGDVHGAFKALQQVLDWSKFDFENDTLISLGDLCDGWPETPECIDELMKVKNLVFVEGNHDQWFLDYCHGRMKDPREIESWLSHGGAETLNAYKRVDGSVPVVIEDEKTKLHQHVEWMTKKMVKYYVDDMGRAFVHTGIQEPKKALDLQSDYCWNRHFYKNAITWHRQNHTPQTLVSHESDKIVKEWFVGHTPTINFKEPWKGNLPVKLSNINFIDTGAAFEGFLTMMNVDTGEYVQSDYVQKLYPENRGRNKKSYNDTLVTLW